ncbi:ABC transporter permease [Blastococcus sp. SYSU D00669]
MTAALPREAVPEETLADRLRWAVADAVTVAGRDVAHWRRQPAGLLVNALFPVLLLLMFLFLLGGGMAVPGGGSYREFLVPGLLAITMAFGIEGTMTAVVTDTARGVTDRFRSLPMAPSAVVAGRCLADMLSSAVGLLVLVVASLAVGWRPADWGALPAGIGLLLLLRLGFLWAGIWLGLVARDPASVTAVQILVWPFVFLSNAFVAASAMPGWLATVAEWNPLAATVTAGRDLFGAPVGTGGGWATEHAMLLAVAWPVVLTAVFAVLAVRRYQGLSR